MDKQYNADEWFVWEQNSSPMLLILTLNPSFQHLREYMGSCLFNTLVVFETDENKNYQAKWIFRYDEGRILGQKMVDMLLCPPYMVAFNSGVEVSEGRLIRRAKEIQESINNIPFSKLPDVFDELCNLYYAYYRLGAFTEPVQWHTEYLLSRYLEKHYSGPFQPGEALKYLLVTDKDSFALDILRDLRECAHAFDAATCNDNQLQQFISAHNKDNGFAQQICDYVFNQKNYSQFKELITKLNNHSTKYHWKNNNYYSTHYVSSRDVLVDLVASEHWSNNSLFDYYNHIISTSEKEKERQLQEKASVFAQLPSYYQNIVSIANCISELIDSRKKNVMTCNSAFDAILSSVANYTNGTLEELHLLIPQELRYYISDPASYKERFAARRNLFICLQTDFPIVDELIEPMDASTEESILSWKVNRVDEPFIAEGEEAERVLGKINARMNLFTSSSGEMKTIQGVTAFYDKTHPVFEGVVKIIKNPKEEKIENEDILVAPSTTPDYINAINKCKVIVTDWGGQTSHAAIVSREMKKPCIIGTNYASHILHDGNRVRVDFIEGTIELIS